MARTLSTNARASLMAENTGEVWLALLTIDHPSFSGTPLRFVNNNESVVSRTNVYVALPFEIELPGQDPESPGEARLKIDNIDREMVKDIREITGPLEVTIEVIMASAPDTVELAIPAMTMRNVEWDALTVSGTLRFEDLITEPVSVLMTKARFPGLN